MDKITVQLENCFGIKKFETVFDFSEKNGYIIYASNGSMKTSFAKTFKAISQGKQPADEIFARPTSCVVQKDGETAIGKEEIFVIDPYDASFESNKVSTLLANKELQEKYDHIHKSIDITKQDVLKDLKEISSYKGNVEEEFCQSFGRDKKSFLELMSDLEPYITSKENDISFELANLKYATLFSAKAIDFVNKGNTPELIAEYTEKYNELLENSTFLKKGIFTHNNASEIGVNLHKNGFFEANHTLVLNGDKIIKTQKELDVFISEEKGKILGDKELKKRFDNIDKALVKNAELRDFREIIEDRPELIAELKDIAEFKRKIWILSLRSLREKCSLLIKEYKNGQAELEKIIEEAKEEQTEWEIVLRIFKDRFSVPFDVNISNQEDVILKSNAPAVTFTYVDETTTQEIQKNKLIELLSLGERRALYLLNIIFEIEARKKENKPVLLIADDIADSFDYKNKYAIIEYLKEIIENGLFKVIVLTHNFDFYRTVGNRLLGRSNCKMVQKYNDRIELCSGGYIQNVFDFWKNRLDLDDKVLIASIPFVRNIVEYLEGNSSENYMKLTTLLHLKNNAETNTITKDITLSDLEGIFNDVWRIEKNFSKDRTTKSVYSLIFEVADHIVTHPAQEIKLENKIALSIAIRLQAEEIMIEKINRFIGNDSKTKAIPGCQTGALFDMYKGYFPEESGMITLLGQVSLMTPENIHLNSFMYEPILDMSETHLIRLYSALKAICVPA